MPDYRLQWSDEFESNDNVKLNSQNWNFDIGDGSEFGIPGWGNQEREYYVENAINISESILEIKAKRMWDVSGLNRYLEEGKEELLAYYNTPAEWTSVKITTFKKVAFQYGKIEARIKVPKGAGVWPAFWMLGVDIETNTWPLCGEIDILEVRGQSPSNLVTTLHGPDYCGEFGITSDHLSHSDLSSEFHTYAIEWVENQISWFLDEQLIFTLKKSDIAPKEWVFNKPFYIIVNLAMGGNFVGEIAHDIDEAVLLVDYIRHYSIDGIGEVTVEVI